MKKRLILMLAVLAFTLPSGSRRALAATEAGSRAAASVKPEQVLPICDKALVAAMSGHDAVAVLKVETKDMSAEDAGRVVNVCMVYLLGAIAIKKHEAEAEAAAIPAGGTSI